MHKVARQKKLLALLSEQGQSSVAQLAQALQVSVDTVRRDLNDLQQQGLAQKNHGGAIALDVPVMTRRARSQVLSAAKQRLGQAVAAQIPPGSTLMLDAGSTVLAVASALTVPARIITASLDIACTLSNRPNIELILLGGQWDNDQRLFTGAATLAMLQRYRADIVVLGACALHPTLGLSASQEEDAEIKRAMLACSAARWLVVDHLKLNRCQPHRVADLAAMQRLFIDRPWDELPALHSTDVSVIAEGEQDE